MKIGSKVKSRKNGLVVTGHIVESKTINIPILAKKVVLYRVKEYPGGKMLWINKMYLVEVV